MLRLLTLVGLCALMAVTTMAAPASPAADAPAPARGAGMSLWQAAVLGVVEGLTEYLPVSSTGHLILAERLMGIGTEPATKDAADAYAVVIQMGAILAVLGLYFSLFRRMGLGLLGRDRDGLRLLGNLGLAFLPAAFLGLTAHKVIKLHLFGLTPVAIAWFVGGIAILAVSRWYQEHPSAAREDLLDLRWSGALLIGLMQCIAVWPGTSRSLVTIVGGLLVGLNLQSAVIFSFLLGAITLGASTGHDLMRHGPAMLAQFGAGAMVTGVVTALVSAALAVRWMVSYLKGHGLSLFGYYRVALALLVAALIAAGVVPSH